MIDFQGDRLRVNSPQHAVEMFDESIHEITGYRECGKSVWFVPDADDDEALRIDIDIEIGRASLRWLSDSSIGVELDPGPSIIVLPSVDDSRKIIPGTIARVSVPTARRAVIEYLSTGERPTCVRWTPMPDDPIVDLV